jgi:O-antigen/teichoic acid export membrane protein
MRRLIDLSLPLLLQDTLSYLYAWFDRAVLLSCVSLQELGTYNVVITAFGVISGVPAAIGTALLPTYSTMHSKHGGGTLSNSVTTASRYMCLIGVPLSLGLLSTARPSLALFVGEPYVEGTQPLMAVSLFFAFTLVSAALTGLLIVMEETTLLLKISALSFSVGVASASTLAPSLGMVGASLARGFAMLTELIATTVVLRRRIHLNLDMEAFSKSFASSTVMACVTLLIQSYYYNKFLLPLYVLVGAVTYFAMLLALRTIKPRDMEIINEYLGPRFRFIAQPIEALVAAFDRTYRTQRRNTR